jgi:hypothetical protein
MSVLDSGTLSDIQRIWQILRWFKLDLFHSGSGLILFFITQVSFFVCMIVLWYLDVIFIAYFMKMLE